MLIFNEMFAQCRTKRNPLLSFSLIPVYASRTLLRVLPVLLDSLSVYIRIMFLNVCICLYGAVA